MVKTQIKLLSISTLTLLLLDQLTKLLLTSSLGKGASLLVINNFFSVVHFTNTGVGFGLLKGYNILFVVLGLAITVALTVYAARNKVNPYIYGAVIGGALGNLTDRLLHGHVIDFIYFHFWPAFNLADAAITVGIILILAQELRN